MFTGYGTNEDVESLGATMKLLKSNGCGGGGKVEGGKATRIRIREKVGRGGVKFLLQIFV